MLLVAKILHQSTNLELQHAILNLLEALCLNKLNIIELIDKTFINIIIQYISLIHLHPDGIDNLLTEATKVKLLHYEPDSKSGQSSGSATTQNYDRFIDVNSDNTRQTLLNSTHGDIAYSRTTTNSTATNNTTNNTTNTTYNNTNTNNNAKSSINEKEDITAYNRQLYIPNDSKCPKIWYISPTSPYTHTTPIVPPATSHTVSPSNQHTAPLTNTSSSIKGPYLVSELVQMYDQKVINSSYYVAPLYTDTTTASDPSTNNNTHTTTNNTHTNNTDTSNTNTNSSIHSSIDTGIWKPIYDYYQLKLQLYLTTQGYRAIYTPAEVAQKALLLLININNIHNNTSTATTTNMHNNIHNSTHNNNSNIHNNTTNNTSIYTNIYNTNNNTKPIKLYPIPKSKQLLSSYEYISILTSLLLCNNNNIIIDNICILLISLTENGDIALISRLYLSGFYYYAIRYTKNNYIYLSKLIYITHLNQSYIYNSSNNIHHILGKHISYYIICYV